MRACTQSKASVSDALFSPHIVSGNSEQNRASSSEPRHFAALKPIERRRIVDQDALAGFFIRRPLGEKIEQNGVIGFMRFGDMWPVAAPDQPLRSGADESLRNTG